MEHRAEHASQWGATMSLAAKFGRAAGAWKLKKWCGRPDSNRHFLAENGF